MQGKPKRANSSYTLILTAWIAFSAGFHFNRSFTYGLACIEKHTVIKNKEASCNPSYVADQIAILKELDLAFSL